MPAGFTFRLRTARPRADVRSAAATSGVLAAFLGAGDSCATHEAAVGRVREALQAAVRASGAAGGYVLLSDEARRMLSAEAAFSVGTPFDFPPSRLHGEGIEGRVVDSGRPLAVGRTGGEAERTLLDTGVEAALAVPLRELRTGGEEGDVFGVLSLVHTRRGARFSELDIERTGLLAGVCAAAFVSARAHAARRSDALHMLETTVALMDGRDPSSQKHSSRVAVLCDRLARRMGLDEEVARILHTGALLHDIGKVAIPEAILRKPGRLTDEELETLKRYPEIGFELCKPLGLDADTLMLIRNHTERLDGSGYPDGLQMGEIPLPLRILSVADAFDAMSSYRPYRERLDAAARRQQLNRFAGSQFDPNVVEALKRLVDEGELEDLYADQDALAEQNAPALYMDQAA